MGGKILMVVAFRDFQDEEYFLPKEILEKAGYLIVTSSDKKGTAIGINGGEIAIDVEISEINPLDYQAVVFIGGSGMTKEINNEKFQKLAGDFFEKEKIISAICIAPLIFAKARILKGKKSTVWFSSLEKGPIKILEESGAIFEDKSVVVDGNIITANGPQSAKEFGEAIVEAIEHEA